MNKSIHKFLSLTLACVLLLSMCPLAAFADETENHECDSCAVNHDEAVPLDTHDHVLYHTIEQVISATTETTHTTDEYDVYTCSVCTYTQRVYSGSFVSAHDGEKIGLHGNMKTMQCRICGRIYYESL